MSTTTFAVDMIGIEDTPEVFPLDTIEQQTLERHEAVITKGLATYIEVGRALLDIRDQRLYRATHKTYADYCNERWGMSRQRAYQLIDASDVATSLSTIVDTADVPESHMREIAKAAPADRPRVIERATEIASDGPRTAKHIAQAVSEIRETELPPEYDIIKRRLSAHGIALLSNMQGHHRAYVTRKEGMTGVVTFNWADVLSKLERLEAQHDPDPAHVEAIEEQIESDDREPQLAPTLIELDTNRMPNDLHKAGYFWRSATPPTIESSSGWRGDAPTVEKAIEAARTHKDAKGEPITVFPALTPLECKALLRESKLFIASGIERKLPTIGKLLRIAARMALEATEA